MLSQPVTGWSLVGLHHCPRMEAGWDSELEATKRGQLELGQLQAGITPSSPGASVSLPVE